MGEALWFSLEVGACLLSKMKTEREGWRLRWWSFETSNTWGERECAEDSFLPHTVQACRQKISL